jgi:hypothetical protein
VLYEVYVKRVFGTFWNDLSEKVMGLDGGCLRRDKAQPDCYAMDVGIDGEDRFSAGKEKEDGCGLRPDAGERSELGHRLGSAHATDEIEGEGSSGFVQPCKDLLDTSAFLVGQAAGANRLGDG